MSITDDDPPANEYQGNQRVWIVATDTVAQEAVNSGLIELRRDPRYRSEPLTVNIQVGGSATLNEDYKLLAASTETGEVELPLGVDGDGFPVDFGNYSRIFT